MKLVQMAKRWSYVRHVNNRSLFHRMGSWPSGYLEAVVDVYVEVPNTLMLLVGRFKGDDL